MVKIRFIFLQLLARASFISFSTSENSKVCYHASQVAHSIFSSLSYQIPVFFLIDQGQRQAPPRCGQSSNPSVDDNDLLRSSFMTIALQEAQAALSQGEVPVGCVLVINGTVVATGHNLCNEQRSSLDSLTVLYTN